MWTGSKHWQSKQPGRHSLILSAQYGCMFKMDVSTINVATVT